jgi:hypothetical protein
MSLDLRNLDPDTYKTSIKNYLKTQTVFKDYNFEDSNMSVLLDILGHNTYLNTFYKNMIFNESQLDSAVLRTSVVSKAKELNYIPLSRKSSKAKVKITIQATGITSLEIPKGTQFSGRGNLESYIFTTEKSYVAKSSSGTFIFPEVEIYEGSFFTDTYVIDTSLEDQQYIISNDQVDTTSLSVILIEDNGATETIFNQVKNTFGLLPTSNIYFVEGHGEFKYRIVFGQDILGRAPKNNDILILLYRVVNGIDDADDISEFNLDEDIVASVSGVLENIVIETLNSSTGGSERETISSIKFNAPREFSAQESAITETDYKSLILKGFSNKINDVSTYGGEKATPKQYGRVIIALKPNGADTTTETTKGEIYSYIKEYNVGSIRPIIIDGDNFYLKINTTVQFKSSETSLYLSDLESEIYQSIRDYSSESLEKFGGDFRYSKFVKKIDDTDTSVVSNDTSAKLVKRIIPSVNSSQKFLINFGNSISNITSTKFTWIIETVNYPNCYISHDELGNLYVAYSLQSTETIIEKNIGTIDYNSGIVNINKFEISSYTGNFVEVITETKNKDIIMSNEKILNIDDNDVNVSMIEIIV